MGAMTVRWDKKSVARVEKNLSEAKDASFRGMSRAADVGIGKVFKQSQILVPVETGALKASGKTSSRNYKYTVSRTVKYGGRKTYYAIYVHEILDHKHAPPTSAKFVEIPFRKYAAFFRGDLRRYVRGELKAVL